MEKTSTLNKFHVLSGFNLDLLPPDERKVFEYTGTIKKYKKNEFIYEEGSTNKGVYLVQKGMVKMTQINSDGHEQILFLLAPGEFFGHRALLSGVRHTRNAICLDNCEIRFIDSNTFISLLDSSKALSKLLLIKLCHEFTILSNQINLYAQKGIRERLAYALLVLNEKFKIRNARTESSNINISRTNLASYIGTSIDVVSRNLKYYTENNIIRTHGKSIHIIDFDALLKISGIL